jgi:hypothetical protein
MFLFVNEGLSEKESHCFRRLGGGRPRGRVQKRTIEKLGENFGRPGPLFMSLCRARC